jgi:hypothetical protein
MGTKRAQKKYLWTHFVSIPNYGRELKFGQVAVEIKVQFQIPYCGVWILDANFGSRWRCSNYNNSLDKSAKTVVAIAFRALSAILRAATQLDLYSKLSHVLRARQLDIPKRSSLTRTSPMREVQTLRAVVSSYSKWSTLAAVLLVLAFT